MDVIFADSHSGALAGLTPPEYFTKRTPKEVHWLYDVSCQIAEELAGKVNRVYLLGDLIEGPQAKEQGHGLICAELDEQTNIAIDMFKMIFAKIQPKEIWRFAGTIYHETHNGPLCAFDKEFGIEMPKAINEQIARYVHYKNTKACVHFKHEPEHGGQVYPNSALEREIVTYIKLESYKEVPIATHLIRAHRHCVLEAIGWQKRAYCVPCLSFRNMWGLHKGYAKWRPDIGYCTLESDPTDPLMLGLAVRMRTFPLPKVRAHKCLL